MPTGTAMELLEVFDSGTSITIQGGFSQVEIWAIGAGGPGRRGGGGGAEVAYKLYPLLEAEWGTTLTVAIGASVAGSAGGNTRVNGTLNGSTITELKAIGGGRGTLTAGGAGGTGGTGADTYTAGEDGTETDGGDVPGGKINEPTPLGIVTNTHYGAGGPGAASGEAVGYGGAIICFWKQ